jgi:hypothetical protein
MASLTRTKPWLATAVAVAALTIAAAGCASPTASAPQLTTSVHLVSVTGPAGKTGPFEVRGLKHLVRVPFGDVELSIPGKWWVQIPGGGGCVDPAPPGELVLGGGAPLEGCNGQSLPKDVADLLDIARIPAKYANKTPIEIHGLKVIVGPTSATSVTLYVPGSLQEVVVDGPLAPEIAGTVRAAPRATVLGTGSVTKPGHGWHLVSSRGLGVWVPGSWSVSRTDLSNAPLCGTDETSLPAEQVLFDSDSKSVYPPCPFEIPTATQLFGAGGNGLRIDIHPWRTDSGRGALSTSCLKVDEFTVCPYGKPQMGVLEVQVTGGALHHPLLVWIGMSGSGQVAQPVSSN